jgi:hypothetical protein
MLKKSFEKIIGTKNKNIIATVKIIIGDTKDIRDVNSLL